MAKILYVEDNEDNIYMLSTRLRRKGYEVVIAKNGLDGVSMAHNEAPALIVMDLILPELDGWEATRRIKSDPEIRHIPVIALSASVMEEHRNQAMDAGCDDFDTKPIEFKRLLGKIEALLTKHHMPSSQA